ncbi:exodeoxyribonuclease VII small subunit [Bacillus fonticola]|uniref:exodeoxyribonuclease VII small subunit n=1 Tax=Bacillus fonticola TaxID=2728853 RepID=UPI0014736B13|nr:exodeoxyribonuclease VII small subunit [Bacillus fonticola]
MSEESTLTFEEALQKLEKIVEHLEAGDVPLEKALSYYKKGMEYSQFCHDQLQKAEKQLVEVVGKDGETVKFDLDEGENS